MKSCKVYKDGMHFIAMRPTVGISGPRNKPPPEEPIEVIEEQPLLSSDIESDKDAAAQRSETKQSELSSDDDVCPDLVEIEQPPTKRVLVRMSLSGGIVNRSGCAVKSVEILLRLNFTRIFQRKKACIAI